MTTMSSLVQYITNPTIAEALVIQKAVVFDRDLGLNNFILEGDALEIIHALRKDDQSWCMHGHLIDDSKIILHSLHSWQVQHIRREANTAAHLLAKVALQQGRKFGWKNFFCFFIVL